MRCMATITFQGEPVETNGTIPTGPAPAFELTGSDLSPITLADYSGKRVILNIFPSVDTGVCAQSVRTFNEKAAELDNTVVVCASKDLPFALARFCGAEGIDHVVTGSGFRSVFGDDYGVEMTTGPLAGLYSRAVVVIDEQGQITYSEQVAEIGQEPNYDAALEALG